MIIDQDSGHIPEFSFFIYLFFRYNLTSVDAVQYSVTNVVLLRNKALYQSLQWLKKMLKN